MIFCSEVESWGVGDKCHVPIFNFILIWFESLNCTDQSRCTILYYFVAWGYYKIKRWDPHLHVFQKLPGDHSRQRGVTKITIRVRVYRYFFSLFLSWLTFVYCYCLLVILPPLLLLITATIISNIVIAIAAITITITTTLATATTAIAAIAITTQI